MTEPYAGPDEPIFAADRTDNGIVTMIEAMPDGLTVIALERDEGPLAQVATWLDRDGLMWLLSEVQNAVNAHDRQTPVEREAA